MMKEIRVELAQIDLPDFGIPTVEPHLEPAEYAERLRDVWARAAARGIDVLLVYGDRSTPAISPSSPVMIPASRKPYSS